MYKFIESRFKRFLCALLVFPFSYSWFVQVIKWKALSNDSLSKIVTAEIQYHTWSICVISTKKYSVCCARISLLEDRVKVDSKQCVCCILISYGVDPLYSNFHRFPMGTGMLGFNRLSPLDGQAICCNGVSLLYIWTCLWLHVLADPFTVFGASIFSSARGNRHTGACSVDWTQVFHQCLSTPENSICLPLQSVSHSPHNLLHTFSLARRYNYTLKSTNNKWNCVESFIL